jgi:hypothetical protein
MTGRFSLAGRTPRGLWAGALLLVLLMGGGGISSLSGLSPASTPRGLPASPLHVAPVGVPASHASAPHPLLTPRGQSTAVCQDPNTGDDIYDPTTGVNGLTFWPIYPYSGGYPCLLTSQDPNALSPFNDELHATFSSSVVGSATRWSVPLRLPGNLTYAEANAVNDFYVGMVVSGNNSSVDGQSLLQVVFTPSVANGGNVYYVSLSVLALFDSGSCGTAGLPGNGLSMSWNNLNACETDLLGDGKGYLLTGPIPGNDYLRVTFDGANSSAITVYVNDSTEKKYSASYTLSPSTVTNQSTFVPYYNSSCDDICYLNWSMPFGEGFGVDLGQNGLNTTVQNGVDPIWVGSPEYFNGTGYGGDFSTLTLESASGGCSGSGGTIQCAAVGNNWGYPYFQFNGTYLLYGSSTDYNWTTRDFGGVLSEFNTQGQPSDFDPLAIDEIHNSSRVGYIPSGSVVNVSVRAQDFGHVASVNLSYILPDGTQGTVSMTRISGNDSIGVYNGTIPSNGGDGTIDYSVLAESGGGTTERLPVVARTYYTLVRGPIPDFTVTFSTSPSSCGSIEFDGINYTSYQNVTLPADQYTAEAFSCYPYVFAFWSASGILINSQARTSSTITVNLTANATLTAYWRYVRPLDTVNLAIDTNHCGSIILNGVTYSVNTTVHLLDGYSYPMSYTPCALNEFSGWIPSAPVNLSILGGAPDTTLTLHGNGTIELTYLSVTSNPLSIVLDTVPADCGGVLYRGAGYTNGTTLALASGTQYPIEPDPCAGWGLDHWNATPGLTVSGNYVSALGSGILTAVLYEETIVTIETYPHGCGYVTLNDVAYYNGSQIIVTNGSAFLIQGVPCAGFFFSGWNYSGGVYVSGDTTIVYGSGILEAVFLRGIRTDFVAFITNPTGCGVISYNGHNYSGSQYIEVPPNSVAVLGATACTGYGFVSWATGGPGIQIRGDIAYVNGSGSITANFHPLAGVTLLSTPSSCGTVSINGIAYTSGTTLMLPAPDVFSISAQACAHYRLSYWTYGGGANISTANGTVAIFSAVIITAHFTLQVYTVLVDVVPFNCGSLGFASASSHNAYTNNTTVATSYGTYSITAKPCAGFLLERWLVSGGVSVTSSTSNTTTLAVNASGTLTAVYEPVLPSLRIAVPVSAYAGSTVTLTANVTQPVPPYTYTYEWNFGDGTNSTTHDGFATHTYALKGTYLVRVTVIDPYHRTSNATSQISIVGQPAASIIGLSLAGYVAIGIAVVAVALALVSGRRRTVSPAAPPESAPQAPKPSSPPPDTPLPDGGR